MDNNVKHIDKSKFEFVDVNERIFDVKFEGNHVRFKRCFNSLR